MRLVFLGPPGAGKGTQAKVLADEKALLHLSTGDMLRDARDRGTETGLKAKSFMDAGKLVPDAVVDRLVEERLAQKDAAGGFILDGYPRNLDQAKVLDGVTRLDAVVYLNVDDEVLVARIKGRAGDRADDREEIVRERLEVYREFTEPLIEHYRNQGLLREIDGDQPIEAVGAAIRATLGTAA